MEAIRYRRRLYFHAFVLLLLSLVLGFLSGAPGSRQIHWLSAHVTGLMVALLMVAIGVVTPELRLSARGLKAVFVSALLANYTGLGLSLWGAVNRFPLAITTGDPPQAWQLGVFFVALAVVSLSGLTVAVMVILGLRGEPQT
jgi:hypothetical protein